MNLLPSFLNIFFPSFCMHCKTPLVASEKHICSFCKSHFPFTPSPLITSTQVPAFFSPFLPIERALSLCFFIRNSPPQRLLHQMKYFGKMELGHFFGDLLGETLIAQPWIDEIDILVPIPLHWRRKWVRGYNQSEVIAKRAAKILGRPCNTSSLIRCQYTKKQAKIDSKLRFKNISDAFAIRRDHLLQNKHILLIDDVVTTGATLSECAKQLLSIPGTKVSIATIGCPNPN